MAKTFIPAALQFTFYMCLLFAKIQKVHHTYIMESLSYLLKNYR